MGEVTEKWTAWFFARNVSEQNIWTSFLLLSSVILTLSSLSSFSTVLIQTHYYSHKLLSSPLCYPPSFQPSSPKVYFVLYSKTLFLKCRSCQVDSLQKFPFRCSPLSPIQSQIPYYDIQSLFYLIPVQPFQSHLLIDSLGSNPSSVPTSHVIFFKSLNISLYFIPLL